MSVKYFTPSKGDIEQASGKLLFYKTWGSWIYGEDLFPEESVLTIMDFSHLYTEEEKEIHCQWLATNLIPHPFSGTDFGYYWGRNVSQFKGLFEHPIKNPPLRLLNNLSLTNSGLIYGSKTWEEKNQSPINI